MHSWRLIDTRLICVFSSCITDVHQMSFVLRIFNSGMCSCLTFSLSASKKLFNSLTSVGAQQELFFCLHSNFVLLGLWGGRSLSRLCGAQQAERSSSPARGWGFKSHWELAWCGGSAEQQMFLVFPQKIFPEQSSIQEFKLHKRAARNKRHFMDDRNESVFLFITCSLNTSVYAALAQQPQPSALSRWIGISARRLMCYVASV